LPAETETSCAVSEPSVSVPEITTSNVESPPFTSTVKVNEFPTPGAV